MIEGETARDLPLVLPEEKQIVPFVILERLTARKGPVDCGCEVGNIVDETLESGIRQSPAGDRYEETLDLRPPEVGSELQRVSAADPGDVVLELIDVVETEIRQIYRQTDGGALVAGIEAGKPQFGNFDRGDFLRSGIFRCRRVCKSLIRCSEFVNCRIRKRAR